MKKLFIALLIIALGVNAYYTRRIFKFAKASEEYFKFLELKTNCMQAKIGMNQSDIFLAAQGRTRESLKGKDRKYLPVRSTYDTQNEECRAYATYMCWFLDLKDPVSVEACGSKFMSPEELAEFKRTGKTPWEK